MRRPRLLPRRVCSAVKMDVTTPCRRPRFPAKLRLVHCLWQTFYPFGNPSTRSAIILRWISAVPAAIVAERERKKLNCQAPS